MRLPPFWIVPVISAAAWVSMLLAMLIKWITDGSPHYPSMSPDQHIAYISDVGAQYLKPLFIAGGAVTVILLDIAIIADRWLRHRGFLVPNNSVAEKVLAGLGIAFALGGGAGMILLSVFDTLHYPHLHDGFLLLFMGGYVLAAVCLCAEYQRLGIKVRQHRVLRYSFWTKLAFILIEVVLGICFVALNFSHKQQQAAIFEWVVAFVFTFWVLSFVMDLLPVARSERHSGKGPVLEMQSV